jgi:heme exporter protein A
MLDAIDLECVRGERRLFSGLSFNLLPRTLLEVRGANGSGKTSLLRMLCGLLSPAAGSVTWNGTAIRALGDEYRTQVVYLGHLNAIKDELTAIENLQFSARLAAIDTDAPRAAAALDWFGLAGFLHQPCKTLSQGQRRRVALARLRLSAAQPLWILDEPFSALDASALVLTQSLLGSHLEAGGLVILTTHQEVAIAAPSTRRIDLGS